MLLSVLNDTSLSILDVLYSSVLMYQCMVCKGFELSNISCVRMVTI
jgi:hypothetical protein